MLSLSTCFSLCVMLGLSLTAEAGEARRAVTSAVPDYAIATNPAAATQQQAAVQRATDVLRRSTATLQALQAAQGAARAAALAASTNIPNGLTAGGLQVATGADAIVWLNASPPTQTQANGQTQVTVNQTAGTAVLSWDSFNIGKETTLTFNQQGHTDWIALNKVVGDSTAPSQILGRLKADGQVYVLNQNGIIFGGASQVDVHTLVASALPLNDVLWATGAPFSGTNTNFLFTAYSDGAFTAPAATVASQNALVFVEAGAQIATTTSTDHNGGFVALIGPRVLNAGTITAPDGQVALAAGQQVAVLPHNSADSSLRGNDFIVGSVYAPAIGVESPQVGTASFSVSSVFTGTAANTGLIEADRGSILVTGANVNQDGALVATTSVAFNGRIDLQAQYGAVASAVTGFKPVTGDATWTDPLNFTHQITSSAGIVSSGQESLLQIMPELSGTDTVAGTSLALKSTVNLLGRAAYLGVDSQILAPSGNVTIKAGNALSTGAFDYTLGQIYLDTGASIDVAGLAGVEAPASKAIIAVQLLGAELADSPLQRESILRGQTVYVDIRNSGTRADGSTWIGTPLADVSGYVAAIKHTVGELSTSGGSVVLNAGNAVTLQQGSTIDVSNGWINYQAGAVKSTKLVSGGTIYDISQASPDLVYSAILGTTTTVHAKWGVIETWGASPTTWSPAYLQGGNGGSLSIQSAGALLDGTLTGSVVTGELQRAGLPAPGSFTLNLQSGAPLTTPLITQDIVFKSGVSQIAPAFDPSAAYALVTAGSAAATEANDPTIYLSPGLVGAEGFGRVSIASSNGNISVLDALAGRPAGSLALTGKNIAVEADIILPGGALALGATAIDPTLGIPSGTYATGAQLAGRGVLTVDDGVTLSTAGLLINDALSSASAGSLPVVVNGGSINLSAFQLSLGEGNVVDVSAGGRIAINGRQSGGKGGSLAIQIAAESQIDPQATPGSLVLGGTLRGYGTLTGKGGSLSLSVPAIAIGGAAPAGSNALWLAPGFFDQGGFATFALSGTGELPVAGGTLIDPSIQSYAFVSQNGSPTLAPALQAAELRSPFSLSLNATNDGAISIGPDTRIQASPTSLGAGSVSLGASLISVRGSIVAPGGTISLTSTAGPTIVPLGSNYASGVTIALAPGSLLSTAGASVITPDSLGHRLGSVLNGGNITINGALHAGSGSVIDVRGTSGLLDVLNPRKSSYTRTEISSNGGTLTLAGKGVLLSEATLLGGVIQGTGTGGSLIVSSSNTLGQEGSSGPGINLLVAQNLPAVGTGASGTLMVGGAPLQTGYFAIDSFTAGGFDALTLGGNVGFTGPVSIAARKSITLGTGSLLVADNAVSLSAPYVALGTAYAQQPVSPTTGLPVIVAPSTYISSGLSQGTYANTPTYGAGTLTVNATDLLDLGTLALQGIGTASLASTRDVRGYGTFEVAGALTLTAGQIYPTSATLFTLAAFDHAAGTGSITVNSSGVDRALPLTAGGTLNVYATTITQNGVLRAPLGRINLGSTAAQTALLSDFSPALSSFATTSTLALGAGSETSVYAGSLVIPYGTELNGTNWLDPLGNDITASGVPQKAITLAGGGIDIGTGATLDLRGGGDLLAYNWVAGLGGSKDLLASTTSFAILPGYQADYAPLLTVTQKSADGTVSTAAGWSAPAVGRQIWLDAGGGLPAGYYTLLPARYALLAGAWLVTPVSGTAGGLAVTAHDGSSVVTGRLLNALNGAQLSQPSLFAVASNAVVKTRAQYALYTGSATLAAGATAAGNAIPRLPVDAGSLSLLATSSLALHGSALLTPAKGGLGGNVDISSSNALVINTTGTGASADTLYLDAASLSAFGAQSLLIGGYRTTGAGGVGVTVTTGSIEVDNAGSTLFGPEVILVSNGSLLLDEGAEIEQRGLLSGAAQTLVLGNTASAGSGNGTLLRVSSDPGALINRLGVTTTGNAAFSIGPGAVLSGRFVDADSTGTFAFNPAALVSGTAVTLGAGRVSLVLDDTQPTTGGLILPKTVLTSLQGTVSSLSLLSYSSLDLYGTGEIGAVGANGTPTLDSFTLHAAGIRGFNAAGGPVVIHAGSVTLDNRPNAGAVAAVTGVNDTPAGSLVIDSGTLTIGANPFNVVGYSLVDLGAAKGLFLSGQGGFSTAGDLRIAAAGITAGTAASQSLTAGGKFTFDPLAGAPSTTAGLGASLTLTGNEVFLNGGLYLPSGTLTARATGPGDVILGTTADLDVSGVAKVYYDRTQYTSGGTVALLADQGDVRLQTGSVVDVSAQSVAGDAGTFKVAAVKGTFASAGSLLGNAGAKGTGGRFSLDAAGLPGLGATDAALNAGGFTQGRSYRVRTGDVAVDGNAKAATYIVTADSGALDVTGTIDASGVTGGSIGLYAYNGVTLESGSLLTVAATKRDNAGKGGAIEIETGEARLINGAFVPGSGWIDFRAGSTIDLSVSDGAGGTLHLRAPQLDTAGNPIAAQAEVSGAVVSGVDVAVKPLAGTIRNASSVLVEGFKVFDVTGNGGIIDPAVQGNVNANGQAFTGNTGAITDRLLAGTPNAGLGSVFHLQPGAEVVTQASLSLTLGAGATLNVPAGDTVVFRGANTVAFNVGGTITHADGSTAGFLAGQSLPVVAGDRVALDDAGVLTAGASPTALSLSGSLADSSIGAGTATLKVLANGTGMTLNGAGSLVTLPAAATVTFPSATPAGDIVALSSAGTLVIPAGGTATQLIPAGTTFTLSSQAVVLPVGDSLVVVGTSATLYTPTGGDRIALASGVRSLTLAASTTTSVALPSTADTLTYSYKSGTGNYLVTISATVPFTVAGSAANVTYNAATGLYSTTTYAANAVVKVGAPGTVSWSVPGSGTSGSGGYGGFLTYTAGAAGNTAIATLSANTGSASPYTLWKNAAVVSVAASTTMNGSVTLAGANPVSNTLVAGSTTLPAGALVSNLPAGSTFRGTGSGNVTLSSGTTALALNLPGTTAGTTYTTAGRIGVTPSGDLLLPATINGVSNDWNLAAFRYGPGVDPNVAGSGEPGVLTLRAPGNVVLQASLTDGFMPAGSYAYPYNKLVSTNRWNDVLLPAGSRSWSYRLTAGADLASASHAEVVPLASLPGGSGSVQLGVSGNVANPSGTSDATALFKTYYQVIRTGTGDIDINAGRDVQLLNQFASIYTAGSQVSPGEGTTTTLSNGGTVSLPASLAVTFPNGTPAGDTVTASSTGVITRTYFIGSGATDGTAVALPAGTVYTLPYGSTTIGLIASRNQLTFPSAGSTIALTYGGTIAGFTAGSTLTLSNSTPISADTLYSTSGGTITVYNSAGKLVSAPASFAAGFLPATATSGGYLIVIKFDAAATVTNLSLTNASVGGSLLAGTYTVTSPAVTLTTAGIANPSSLNGFRGGDQVTVPYGATSATNTITLEKGGTYTLYTNGVAGPPVAVPAGGSLPALTIASGGKLVITLTQGGRLFSGTGSAQYVLTPAQLDYVSTTITGTGAPLINYAGASVASTPAGTTIRPLDASGGGLTPIGTTTSLNVATTQILQAHTPTSLAAGSTVTLDAAGALAVNGTGAASLLLPANVTTATADGIQTVYYSFDRPNTAAYDVRNSLGTGAAAAYLPQYSDQGGNVTIAAGRDIVHLTTDGADDSSLELPINWLYRRSAVLDGRFTATVNGDIASTTWWVDYSNFTEGVGTLGGGNVTLSAGRDVKNVDAVAPTNAWMSYQTTTVLTTAAGTTQSIDARAAGQTFTEYGGGDVTVTAGRDINAGIYYVENGAGTLAAGRDVTTNSTRTTNVTTANALVRSTDSADWLPTSLFLGKGGFEVRAGNDLLVGPALNPFLLPSGINNGYWDRAFFTTAATTNSLSLESLTGSITLKGYLDPSYSTSGANAASLGTLAVYIDAILAYGTTSSGSYYRPWLRLNQLKVPVAPALASAFDNGLWDTGNTGGTGVGPKNLHEQLVTATSLLPATLEATAFTGDLRLVGRLDVSPSPTGTISLLAAGSIDGYQRATGNTTTGAATGSYYQTATLNLSDADPDDLPSITRPLELVYTPYQSTLPSALIARAQPYFTALDSLFAETGATLGAKTSALVQNPLHDADLLHAADPIPAYLYAGAGDIGGLLLYSAKETQIIAGRDISDVGLYLQNNQTSDVSLVIAGRDLVAYNEKTPSRLIATTATGLLKLFNPTAANQVPLSGDISIGGPGTLEVLAGRNLNTGGISTSATTLAANGKDGVGLGILSIGNARNPFLGATGADIVAGAGIGAAGAGLDAGRLDFNAFIKDFIDPLTAGDQSARNLASLGLDWPAFAQLPQQQRNLLALQVFYEVLRDAGRSHTSGVGAGYETGYQAIAALFGEKIWTGDISLTSREIQTRAGGDISLLAPGGSILVGYDLGGKQPLDQGIMTLRGGNISTFSRDDVQVGTSRIFTFQGGNEIIWSTLGDIAAGSAAKTLQSAPPSRFLINQQTGARQLDLAGLATGGGIGVLATLKGVPPGEVDLIAPVGVVDAGDAGIRSSGNINIAAVQVLNAGNIEAAGSTSGVPVIVAPNIGNLMAASNTTGAASNAAAENVKKQRSAGSVQELPSLITVEVLGYGGGPAEEREKPLSGPVGRPRQEEQDHRSAGSLVSNTHYEG